MTLTVSIYIYIYICVCVCVYANTKMLTYIYNVNMITSSVVFLETYLCNLVLKYVYPHVSVHVKISFDHAD